MDSVTILPAVDVRRVYKSYKKKQPVLQSVNLLVKRGHIYGLLGPSGCGKTTLLRCVIGRLTPDSGAVRVLGHTPRTPDSGIPGSKIGYMPQELALYPEFTVEETLYFFGRVHKMTSAQIQERVEFLIDFLDIPSAKRRIDQLSGGQQRRVSLAVALLHKPEVLILDEPTVGVDPLLRQRIWNHLVQISTEEGTSIIITTHYIEEARSANEVGLMRSGHILAAGSPDDLLKTYNQRTLEDVFLTLCQKDDSRTPGSATVNKSYVTSNGDTRIQDDDAPLISSDSEQSDHLVAYDDTNKAGCCSGICSIPSARNIGALVIKNFHIQRKRVPLLLFQFLLPAVQITLFAFCIGGNPKNLNVEIVNEDVGFSLPGFSLPGCDLSLSEAFIAGVAADTDTFKLNYNKTQADAMQSVKNGNAWAVIYLNRNFSRDTINKMLNASSKHKGAQIDLYQDFTNQQISQVIQGKLLGAYQDLPKNLEIQANKTCNSTLPFNPNLAELPFRNHTPVYGPTTGSFLDFMAPGIIISVLYFQAVGLTTLALVVERREGLFDRSLVSGVIVSEVMLGHIISQFFTTIVQEAVLLIFALLVFDVYNVGDVGLIILFVTMVGICGMCFGFILSSIANNEQEATQLGLGTVFPFLLISGILWPIEAMPNWLRYISICLPITLPVQALRDVISRGWGFSHYEVWTGFLIGSSWTIGFLILSLVVARAKNIG